MPKDEHTHAVRALLIARRGAVKARTAAINQIKALLIGTPAELRERYRRHTTTTLIRSLARCRPAALADPTGIAVLTGCKALAQRIEFLDRQTKDLTAELDTLVTTINPGVRAAYGVGPDTAAQLIITAGTNPHRLPNQAAFARLCGAAPIPASSGKTTRHRLSRGGDRAANNALHRIALVRMSADKRTRAYVTRQIDKGPTKPENPAPTQTRHRPRNVSTAHPTMRRRRLLRPTPRPPSQKHHPDHHFCVWPTIISRLERGLQRNDTLAANYRHWLNAA